MRSYLVFSSMGPDRAGLADEIAEFFTARGINIERSRGSVLGGEFGMIILTSGKTDDIQTLINDIESLKSKTGLDIYVRRTKAPSHRESLPSIPYRLMATSLDHPGIVHQICKVLKDRGINIEDIESNVDMNPVSGANVFTMTCHFSMQTGVKISDLRKDLSKIADDFNIDIRLDAELIW
jgi:glycine cleavage system transcriptional repressor